MVYIENKYLNFEKLFFFEILAKKTGGKNS